MDINELVKQNLAFVVLIGAGLGVLLGLVPLILAIRKGKLKLGIIAMVSVVIAGIAAVLSIGIILPLVVMAIFIWLVFRKDSTHQPAVLSDDPESN